MDTKVSWPTVLGIAILGSIVVFTLATLPMNDWLDQTPETDLASQRAQSAVPAETKNEPFEFAPVQIAVGSSNKTPQLVQSLNRPKNQTELPSSQVTISEAESSFDSGLDAVAAQQAQADKLLEIAESLVFQNSAADLIATEDSDVGKVLDSQSTAETDSELLALNPLSGVPLADLGPFGNQIDAAAQDVEIQQGEQRLALVEPKLESASNSTETFADQNLAKNTKSINAFEDALAKNELPENELALDGFAELPTANVADSQLADAGNQPSLDSPLSDTDTDLTPREIVVDDPASTKLSIAPEPSTSNRLKVQTVSQRSIKKPRSNQQHWSDLSENQNHVYQAPSPGMIASPVRLLQELDEAKNDFPEITQWVIGYKLAIGQLCDATLREQRVCLNQLEELRQQLDFLIQKDQSGSRNSELSDLRQLCYSLDRRLDFWQATIPGNPILESRQQQQSARMQLIRSRRWNFSNVKITAQWSEYLMWPQLVRIVNDSTMPANEKQTLAREILTRINSGRLDFQQEAVISQILPLDLQKQLYHHAGLKVDPTEVLAAIEAYEWKGDSLSAMRIMEGYRWLRLSEQVADQQIVQLVENHYRNANVRFTASREFINRWFVSQSWVNQTIAKQKENHVGIGVMPFQIDLIPSESGFHFQLNPAGQDDGNSEGWKSVTPPEENSRDQRSVISVSYEDRNDSLVLSNSNRDVRGGNYQHIPLTDWIARRFPAGMAVGSKVIPIKHQINSSSKLANELGQQLNQRMQNTESAIAHTVRGFQLAGLSPKVIQNSSTADSVVARFRIADNTQLASNTARPNPVPGSLLSLQIHQTFINNALQRIEVAGQSFDWNSLGQHLADVCGLPLSTFQHQSRQLTNDQLHFADEQAIEARFDNDQIQIVLNLKNARLGRLETGPIRLTGCFQSDIHGCNVSLVPAGPTAWLIDSTQLNINQQNQVVSHLEKLRSWQPIRITPSSWENDFLARQLRISQFKLSNGWLSVSVESQPETGSIALTQNSEVEVTDRQPSNNRFIQVFLSDESQAESPLQAVGPEMPVLRSVLE